MSSAFGSALPRALNAFKWLAVAEELDGIARYNVLCCDKIFIHQGFDEKMDRWRGGQNKVMAVVRLCLRNA